MILSRCFMYLYQTYADCRLNFEAIIIVNGCSLISAKSVDKFNFLWMKSVVLSPPVITLCNYSSKKEKKTR